MYIYQKIRGSKFTILVLCVNDILLAANNLGILYKIKDFLSTPPSVFQRLRPQDVDSVSHVRSP